MVITIKKILITSLLLLMTNTSIAAIGDVYSCEWVSSTFSGSDGEEAYWNSPKEFLKKTFVFKREKNNIAFEKDFLSSNTDLQISCPSVRPLISLYQPSSFRFASAMPALVKFIG